MTTRGEGLTSSRRAYLDASALVKLVVRETESDVLRVDLQGRHGLVTSRLGVVEAERAIRRTPLARIETALENVNVPVGPPALTAAAQTPVELQPPLAVMRAVFETVDVVEVSPALMAQAGALTPAELRTLDAIHLATLLLLGAADLDFVTYDNRLATAARQHGFTVVQPRPLADTSPEAAS